MSITLAEQSQAISGWTPTSITQGPRAWDRIVTKLTDEPVLPPQRDTDWLWVRCRLARNVSELPHLAAIAPAHLIHGWHAALGLLNRHPRALSETIDSYSEF